MTKSINDIQVTHSQTEPHRSFEAEILNKNQTAARGEADCALVAQELALMGIRSAFHLIPTLAQIRATKFFKKQLPLADIKMTGEQHDPYRWRIEFFEKNEIILRVDLDVHTGDELGC